MNNKAIGVFDSGIGGLTVYRAIKEKLPDEKIIYLGDTARLPYGTKSAETIIRFSEDNAGFLLNQKVKIIVIACNSASATAYDTVRKIVPASIPVINVIDPVVDYIVKQKKRKQMSSNCSCWVLCFLCKFGYHNTYT